MAAQSSSHDLDYSFANEYALALIKKYTPARTLMGSGKFAAYKSYGEFIWRIGYESKELKGNVVGPFTRATQKEIDEQLKKDLETFSYKVARLIFWPLNDKQKGALLSYAHSVGFFQFKESELLEAINNGKNKKTIIKLWSPYFNKKDLDKGSLLIDRRRSELNCFVAHDKEIPSLVKHKCVLNQCLLNIPATYNGNPNQIKAINYLEKKFLDLDPSGEILRRFFRYWNQPPGNLGSDKNL